MIRFMSDLKMSVKRESYLFTGPKASFSIFLIIINILHNFNKEINEF